jgi:glucose-6-phosphate dehydrogenase assembly protein OpcA
MAAPVTGGTERVRTFWRSVAPSAIEPELASLWRAAAEQGPLSRALMCNLVVVRPDATIRANPADEIGPELLEIALRHPARTLIFDYRPRGHRASAPVAARVGVIAFAGHDQHYGVEVIAIETSCSDASIPSIVRRLTRGDVPTTVWWAADLSTVPPPPAVIGAARQVLYDSAAWRLVPAGVRTAAAMLSLPHRPDLADLNWRRMAPLRSAIVHALEIDPAPRALGPSDIHIRFKPGHASAAWLIAAWFGCRLKWRTPAVGSIEEARNGDDLVTVTLWSGDERLVAAMSPQRVMVKAGRAPAFRTPVPRYSAVDAVIEELRSLGHDRCLHDAVAVLAGMPG